MKKYIVILLAVIAFAQETPANAQAEDAAQIRADTAPHLNNAKQLIEEDEYAEALSGLDETLKNSNLTSYEKSLIYKMKAAAHYELKQYRETIQALEDAIAAGGLPDNEARVFRLNIAQLLIAQGEYERGADMLVQWSHAGNELKPGHVEMIIQAYNQSYNYELALPWAERWYAAAKPKERKHFDLMNFLYNNLGSPDKQIEIIKDMIEHWPDDKSLWDSLASIHFNKGQYREAFEVTRKSYLRGNIRAENDILRIVKHHSDFDMPFEAGRILEKEMNAGRVANTLQNTVWLSMLYQDAGSTAYANTAFAEAIQISSKTEAEDMRELLKDPEQTRFKPDWALRGIPPFPPGLVRVSDRDAQPLERIRPAIPKSAKKSGHCKLRFGVDSAGIPANITITSCTEKLFETPAIESVEQWKFRPKIIDGRQVARFGVETRVKFLVRDKQGQIIPE